MPEAPKRPPAIFALSSWEYEHGVRSAGAALPWEHWADGQRMRAELAEADSFKFLQTEAPDSPENHAPAPFRPGGPLPK